MQINITWDASTASAPAGFQTAVNAAVQYLENTFSAPITINISVGWGEVGGTALYSPLDLFRYSSAGVLAPTAPNASFTAAMSGPSWHIVGTGDHNGDGKADILWQNDNGQAGDLDHGRHHPARRQPDRR
jgi:hypothetical protein